VLSDGGRTGRPKKEEFAPGAFAYRVNKPDEEIHLLVGHSFDKPLASKAAGTLTLQDSDEALTFEATITPEMEEVSYVRDVLATIDAGLTVGISPGFRIPPKRAVPVAEKVTEEPIDPAQGMHGALIRTILSALLYELSIVTRPAYKDSTVQSDASDNDQSGDDEDKKDRDDQIAARNWELDDASGLILPKPHYLARWRP
jgi:HK97 family phage prohead protease